MYCAIMVSIVRGWSDWGYRYRLEELYGRVNLNYHLIEAQKNRITRKNLIKAANLQNL